MEIMGITSVGSITVICYLIASLIKQTPVNNKWLPIICGVLGGILGLVAKAVVRDFPAADSLTACAVGIVSGFAATGINQVLKQLSTPDAVSSASGNKK
jgi:uncharacterized membrane protein YeaQ/YmgE (transglycosylase-associated protein family)